MKLNGTIKTLNPSEVIVNIRQRQTFDDEKYLTLKETIKESGQLQPILLDLNLHLIAGERRLRVCKDLDINVTAFVLDHEVKEEDSLLYEILENFQRDNFTPAEEYQAVEKFHLAMIEKHGIASAGRYAKEDNKTKWSQQKTADALGIKQAAVNFALKGAKAIQEIPELAELSTKQEIQQKMKRADKYMAAVKELAEEANKAYEEALENPEAEDNFMKELLNYSNEDLFDYTISLKDNSIDAFLLDPPWGINIDKNKLSTPGKTTNSKNIKGFSFDDSTEPALRIYKFLAKESFRLAKEKAQGYVFAGTEHTAVIRKMFEDAGWLVYVKPFIWVKPTGQCNVPEQYPASRYESFLFIRRQPSRLFETGRADVLHYSHVSSDKKIHINEKPVEFYLDLLERITIEGMSLFDPTVGSGASLEAGLKHGLTCYGCELDTDIFNFSNLRLNKVLKDI